MIEAIVALVAEQVGGPLRRAAGTASFALIAALFVFFAVAGLFAALFFWLEPERGPIVAALLCVAVAFGLALVSTLPLLFRPRPPPPPPPDAALPQLLMLLTRASSSLTPRQLILTAAVVGFALALSGRRGEKK